MKWRISKHWDVLVNYVFILAQALHWYNPIVWLALRRARAERELYCDAVVLSRLTSAERHAYGNTLLKVCEAIARPVLNPNFVPILSRKPQIHRRITMTTQFKPASRIAVLAALCVTLVLGGLTFTGAAEKEPRPRTASPPSASASAPEKTPATREAVSTEILMKRLSEQEESIRKTRSQMDDLRNMLQITGDEATVAALIDNQNSLRRLESNRIEAEAEYKRFVTLYTNLTHLSRVDLKRSLSTALPDQLLSNLLDRYHTAEQKVAELSEKFAPEHPDVKQAARVLKLIDKQIEDRIDGILTGLKIKCEAERANTSELGKQIENAKKRQVQETIERRPYEEAKRELQRKEQLRDRLELLLLEKEIGALPSKSE